MRTGNPFEDAGYAAHWSDKNKRQVCKSYGQWLTWYREHIGPLEETLPAARLMPNALKGYYQHLRSRVNPSTGQPLSPVTVESRFRDLYEFARVTCPDADLDLMKRVLSYLRTTARPTRN